MAALSRVLTVFALCLGLAATVQAASIIWGGIDSIGNNADATLTQAGTVTEAAAWGTSNITVTYGNASMITFTGGTINGGAGPVADVSPENNTTFQNDFTATGNTNFNTVMSGFAYDGNNPVISIFSLTPGQRYSVQLFAIDDRGGANTRIEAFSDGNGNQTANFVLGSNSYVLGSFIADGTTQTINVLYPNGQNASNVNALVIRQINQLNATWTNGGSGSWGAGGNWDQNIPPTLAGDSATFGPSAPTGAAAITLDGNRSVGSLTFNNGNAVTINQGSSGTLTFDNAGGGATITVSNGSHTINAPVALNSPTTVNAAPTTILTISGPINDGASSNGLTLAGGGTLALSGSNGYSAGTTINAGILNINADAALGAAPASPAVNLTFSGSGTLRAGGAVNFVANRNLSIGSGATATFDTGSNSMSIAGNIGGVDSSSALAKIGLGTLRLSGTNTYGGPTTVGAGTLVLTSSNPLGNTAIAVAAGGTVSVRPGSGIVTVGSTATTSLGASLTLSAGTGGSAGGSFDMVDNAIGTFNLQQGSSFGPGLTLGGAGTSANAPTLSFEFGNNSLGSVDKLIVSNGVVVNATGATIEFTAVSGATSLATGDYTFMTASSGLGTAGFTLGASVLNVGGTAYHLSLANSTSSSEIVTVTTTIAFPASAYWNGLQNGNWNSVSGSTTNWSTDASGTADTHQIPGPQTNVFFTVTSGAMNLNNSLGQDFIINSLNFTGTGTSAASAISISGNKFTINATNANGNTVGSGITVASGSGAHTIVSNVVLGASQTWANSSTNTFTVNGVISDGGSGFALTTSGPIALSGVNTFSGGTTINSGVLSINADAALGAVPNSAVPNLSFAGNGTLRATGTANLAATRNLSIAAGVTATFDTNANSMSIAGAISGGDATANVVKVGAGTLSLTGSSSYSGGTTIAAGTLRINADAALGTAPASSATNLTFMGNSTLQAGGTVNLAAGRNVLIGSGVTASFDPNSNTLSAAGNIGGGDPTSNLVVSGSGTLRVSGTNTYAGGTTINAGTLNAVWAGGGDFASLPIGGAVVDNSALIITRNSNDARLKAIITGPGTTTITGDGGYVDLGDPGDGIARLSSQSDLTVNIGLNLFDNPQTIGALNGNGTILSNGGIGGSVTLTIGNNNDSGSFSGTIINDSEMVAVAKVGSGVQSMTGSNGYTGPTTISAGTLSVSQLANGGQASGVGQSSNAATNLLIANGATLAYAGGTASTDRNFTIAAGGTGTIRVTNAATSLTLTGGAAATTGTLAKTGPGTLVLSANNSNTGGLLVNGGTVLIAANQTYGGATTIQSGTLRLNAPPSAPVAGAAYWLDASNAASLNFSGSSVTAINDLSGNNRNFATNGASAPTLVPNALNGHPVVQFDGSSNTLSYAGGNVNAQTVFIVNTPSSISGFRGIWGNNGDDNGIRLNGSAHWQGGPDGGGDGNDFANNGGGTTYITTASSFDVNTTNFGSVGTPHILTAYGNATYANTGLGNYFSGGGRAYAGDIAEVLVYSTHLSAADRQEVEAYLDAKWISSATAIGNNALPSGTAINLTGSSATFDLGALATTQTIGSLAGVAGSNVLLQASTLITGGDNTDTEFDGVLSGTGSIVKTGSGTMTLGGANTYTGVTTINSGTLRATSLGSSGQASSIGAASSDAGNLVFGPTGTLQYSGASTVTDHNFTIAAGGVATINVANPATFLALTGGASAASTGTLVKTGPGTLGLIGNNAHTGGLTVNGGNVAIGGVQSYTGATVIQSGTLVLAAAPTAPVAGGLQYHLDASNPTNLSLNGANVVSWNDTSGNGNNFTQSISTSQPTYDPTALNGRGTVVFNGTSDKLVSANSAQTQTVFVVNQVSGYTNLDGIFGQDQGDYGIRLNNPTAWQNGPNGNGNDFSNGGLMAINGALESGNGNFTAGQPHILEAVSGGPANFTAGLGEYFNNGHDSLRWYNGEIGEVLVYNGVLSAADQQAVTQYLAFKWFDIGSAGNNLLPTGAGMSLTGSGTSLDLGNISQTIGSLAGVAGSNVNLENNMLTTGGDNSNTAFAGVISGSGMLVKTGSGVLTLSGANLHSGGTIVANGTLTTTSTGSIGSGALEVDGASGNAAVVNLNNSQTVTGLSGSLSGGSAHVNVAAGTTLTDTQASDATFAGTLALANGPNLAGAAQFTMQGTTKLTIGSGPSLGNYAQVNVDAGTLKFANSSAATIGTLAKVNVSGSAVLELAGSVSALSSGPAAVNRVAVANNSTAAAGVLVSGANQQTGGIDGTGNVQVNANASLTADHITAGSLIIGGDASDAALVTIAASNPDGTPMASASGFALAGSLAPSAPFAAGTPDSSSLLGADEASSEGGSGASGSLGALNLGGAAAAVPEPSTMFMAVIGMISCGWTAWRKRKS